MIFAILTMALSQPVTANAWPLDELIHTNGAVFRGVILAESDDGVRFQVVTRVPGRPTVTLTTTFTRLEVERLIRLSDGDRNATKTKLAELDPSGKCERERMDALQFTAAEWLGKADAAKRYDSDHFVMISNASEEISRRAVVRVEQLFAAFRRYLPPRNPNGRPTTIYLATTPQEYRAILGPTAPTILNSAIYDPTNNRIVCGSDLQRLGEDLKGTRIHHERQRLAIDRYETEIRKLYKDQKTDLERFQATIQSQRQRIVVAEVANENAFNTATKQLFAVLYHEAFHAYAASFAFPEHELPRWLNEGLAQIFETAIVEVGELHVGHTDAERLKTVRELLKPNASGLLNITELIRTNGEGFLAKHTESKTAVDRVYVSSWAAAHCLLFSRGAVGNDRFLEFLKSKKTDRDPIRSFETWVGSSTNEFDQQLKAYLNSLKSN